MIIFLNSNNSHFISQTQDEVRLCFEQLAKILRTREKQLLRQVQAVHNQQLSIVQSNWEFVPSIPFIKINLTKLHDLQESILKFGELESSNKTSVIVSDAEPYRIEDYEDANRDHISFDKSIKTEKRDDKDSEETSDEFPDSPCQLSFNSNSDADITSENEITVLMNYRYSSSSDGLRPYHGSPENATVETEEISSNDNKLNFPKDFSNSRSIADNLLNNSEESVIYDKNMLRTYRDCNSVPDTKENLIGEITDSFTKDDRNSNKNLSNSPDLEFVEKSEDQLAKKGQDCDQHPKQIQQWLQQILVETETEPTIHEIEQFAEISKSRFKEFQFPLET